MDQLGLGVRLDLDDNMSREINPIIRDLERLRQQASRTTSTFNDMRNAYDPFGRNRRQGIRDYADSMQTMDRVLLNVSNRLLNATRSAGMLSRATNRTQFAGNFNRMYSDIFRVSNMLGNMGFAMTRMQREMSNLRAFNMMDVQMKDLQDRIKQTSQALKEMQRSPDSSKFVKEMDVAKRALTAYKNEMARVGSLQQGLARTHGLNVGNSLLGGNKDYLYQGPQSAGEGVKNQMMGMAMSDMALASSIAYSSLNKTSDMLTGTGYSALDAKKKLQQMNTQLMTLGTTLTTTVSLFSALAIAGGIYAAKQFEKPQGQLQGQSLMTTSQARPYQMGMMDTWQNSTGAKLEDGARMYSTMHNAGVKDTGTMNQIAGGAWEISYAQGTDAVKTLNSVMGIAKKNGISYADSLDILTIALKKTNGDLESATELALENAGAFKDAKGEWKSAFETLNTANETGAVERLINGGKGLLNVFEKLWNYGLKDFVGGLGDLVSGLTESTSKFLEAHAGVAKFLGILAGAILAVGLLAGPVMLVTGFLTKFKNVIQGVAITASALNKGGFAVLSQQSNMVARGIHAATVAFARFPQTLMFAVLPALYNVIRALPVMLYNMAKLNPVMTALTVGFIAYKNNWFGFGDTVRKVTGDIKQSWNDVKNALATGAAGGEITGLSEMESAITKVVGTASIAKDMLKSIFTGKKFEMSTEQQNLAEQLGIVGTLETIGKVGKGTKDFIDGFVSGIEIVYNKFKVFLGWMRDTFEPVIVRISNFVSKMFGGKGDSSTIEDVMGSANGASGTMENLGKMAGIALTALLGFKLLKPLFANMFKALVKNPFGGLISSANKARQAVGRLGGSVRNIGRAGATGAGGVINRRVIAPLNRTFGTRPTTSSGPYTSTMRNRNGSAGTVLARSGPPPLNAAQQRRADIVRTNQNARARGYNVGADSAIRRSQPGVLGTSSRVSRDGTYVNAANSNLNGQQVHRRQQGRFSRAMFGQAYDVYGADGRRTTINRQGGLLRTARGDARVGESMSARDRVGVAGQRAMGAVRGAATSARTSVANAGRAVMATPAMQQVRGAAASAGRVAGAALKPVRVPVNYVMGRLRTAGIIRQGQQGGRQSGNLFKKAFQTATRGMKATARVVGGAAQAGRKAGNTFVKGFGVVGKGIGAVGKMGLRLIPFLGWAIMAWDIIKTIFTNWDAIKNGALKAWSWIKENGVTTLQTAWESIKGFANTAWEWIKANGLNMVISIGSAIGSFLGQAFTYILGVAVAALAWILTDGISMAVKLGGEFIKWIATDAFPKIVTFALETLGGLVTSVVSVAKAIGSSIMEGIKSALSGLGGWITDQIAKVPGGNWVMEKLGVGGKGKKEYANGGFISSPHLGLVGEAGPEVIIPLSAGRRSRAMDLFGKTAQMLGIATTAKDPQDEEVDLPNPSGGGGGGDTRRLSNPVVRGGQGKTSTGAQGSGGIGDVDNSVTIQNLHINLPEGQKVDAHTGRGLAKTLAKELQTLMKQERLRGKGKNLTLEELILDM